jgi:aldose sugar dehydrogenase
MAVRLPLVLSRARALTARGGLFVITLLGVGLSLLLLHAPTRVSSQTPAPPTLVDPALTVRTVVTGLAQPTTMAFIGRDDFLLLEKASGRVLRVTGGVIQGAALDLPVNSASERGMLGIALHPDFPDTPLVYIYWTESSTGADSTNVADVPLLGNRVDRFVWNGASLLHDRTLIRLRALQADAGQPQRGNHNGGVLAFEQDGDDRRNRRRQRHWTERGRAGNNAEGAGDNSGGALQARAESHDDDEMARLFIFIGDVGRRGWMQNLEAGPNPPNPDDQFGGPEPDDAHLTGVILRLNEDGSTPRDNPFYDYGAEVGGEAGRNLQKVFSFGHRNSFGMAVDPQTGHLWLEENGDDAFDEINLVERGMNGGWIQFMGPSSRIAQFKEIEVARPGGLQQIRWPPALIADTAREGFRRLLVIPEARYSEPEFSWKFAVAPAAIGFVRGNRLGRKYEGDMIVGASRTTLANGYLFRLKLSGDRRRIAVEDPRLDDRVADNFDKFDLIESETLLFGRNFGVGTDVQTGPNGNLFVVSLSNGAVYEIRRR